LCIPPCQSKDLSPAEKDGLAEGKPAEGAEKPTEAADELEDGPKPKRPRVMKVSMKTSMKTSMKKVCKKQKRKGKK